jgi:hypothetical protein
MMFAKNQDMPASTFGLLLNASEQASGKKGLIVMTVEWSASKGYLHDVTSILHALRPRAARP